MTISGRSGYVDEQNKFYDQETNTEYTWFDLRPYLVSIPLSDYAKLKKYIIEQCKVSGKCDKEVSSWERTIHNLDEVLEKKSGFNPKK